MKDSKKQKPLSLDTSESFEKLIEQFDAMERPDDKECFLMAARGVADGNANTILSFSLPAARAAFVKVMIERFLATMNEHFTDVSGGTNAKIRNFVQPTNNRAS